MQSCAPWVKYCLLLVLFIFSFMCLFTPEIEIYGFGSFFVLQAILSFFVFVDLTQDERRSNKVLSVAVDPRLGLVHIPLSMMLLAGAMLEFVAAFFTIISMSTVYKRFRAIQLSSDDQTRLSFLKYTFVIVTALMFVLVVAYWTLDFGALSGTIKMVLLMVMVGIVGLSTADVIYSNRMLRLINTMTDG